MLQGPENQTALRFCNMLTFFCNLLSSKATPANNPNLILLLQKRQSGENRLHVRTGEMLTALRNILMTQFSSRLTTFLLFPIDWRAGTQAMDSDFPACGGATVISVSALLLTGHDVLGPGEAMKQGIMGASYSLYAGFPRLGSQRPSEWW